MEQTGNGEIAQETNPSWVWWSTSRTAEDLTVSVLAIVETAAATAAYIWIAWYFETYVHLAVSSCVVPLLLLRTQTSTALGLRLLFATSASVKKLRFFKLMEDLPKYVGALVLGFVFAIIGLGCRVAATVSYIRRRPLNALASVPRNWVRIACCVDSHFPPEVVPGIELQGGDRFLFRLIVDGIRHEVGTSRVAFAVFGMMVFFPSVLYRWSMKGTALVWLTLLWAVRPVARSPERGERPGAELSPREMVSHIRHGLVFKFTVALSVFTFVWTTLFKVLLAAEWNRWRGWWHEYMPRLVDLLVAPLEIHLWHVAALLNSIIAIWLFVWADKYVRHPKRITDERIVSVLGATLTVRRVLTAYTILNCLGLLVTAADLITNLRIDFTLFKWAPSEM